MGHHKVDANPQEEAFKVGKDNQAPESKSAESAGTKNDDTMTRAGRLQSRFQTLKSAGGEAVRELRSGFGSAGKHMRSGLGTAVGQIRSSVKKAADTVGTALRP